MIAGRLFFDVAEIIHGGHIGKPGINGLGIVFVGLVLPVITLLCVAIIITAARFKAGQHTAPTSAWITGAVFACLLSLAVIAIRSLRFLLPGMILGTRLRSSLGFYTGSLVQCAVDAWMLGLFVRQQRIKRQTPCPPAST